MTRVVLDTNILVSALLQPLGPSAQLFLRCLNGSLQLCLTGSIFAEYEEVISRPRLKRSPDVIAGTLRTIRDIGLWVKPSARVTICSDPDDDVFLECAQAANARYVITGNIKHFPPSWAGARVVTPRWLLDMLSAESAEED